MRIFYYPGNHKHDPGWYWYLNERTKFDNGPFYSHGDARADAAGSGYDNEEPPSVPADNTDFTLLFKENVREHPKLLVRVEYKVRTAMLAASVGILSIICWYAVFRASMYLAGF